jgi:NADH-quinone oxidoreductase subunit L
MTHAFFKALLFLAAGSVIIAMHHEQDIRKMGGLRKYLPITYWTSLVGSLALIGFPGLAGFFSKDTIIEAVHASHIAGSGFAYIAVLTGVFITALYSFRMFFLVFHTEERFDEHTRSHLHETPAVVTVPLIMLAIPSVVAGYWIDPVVFGDYFGNAIYVGSQHDVIGHLAEGFHGAAGFILHGIMGPAFWLAMAGLGTAWFIYTQKREIAAAAAERFHWLYRAMVNKYGFDRFNEIFFAGGARGTGWTLWKLGDVLFIDGFLVNGSAKLVGWIAGIARHMQSGYLYHYAFSMIVGLLLLLSWFIWFAPGT